jgi:hypothetical protein
MSEITFKLQLENAMELVFLKYIEKVSSKYNISSDELTNLWKNTEDKEEKPQEEKPQEEDKINIDIEKVLTATKPELVSMCKKYKLKHTGKKQDLISRLVGGEKTKKKKTKKKILKTPPVIKKLNVSIPVIQIVKNKYGNYEHIESGLIFNKNTKTVIGKQHSDGQILDLTLSDIDICNKYKFSYNLPENLNNQDSLDDIKIDDLDDDEIEQKSNQDDNENKEEDENSSEDDVDLEEFYDD